ncbi:unnamed protein product [Tuber aestivum]|uniref:Myb-like domain-containing protein n=1 Tax=Tuber aestivum TaxID=59557 RepID=A0A292Q402_9PEZI|nr:unnamed protein product [Tuber aestivum]
MNQYGDEEDWSHFPVECYSNSLSYHATLESHPSLDYPLSLSSMPLLSSPSYTAPTTTSSPPPPTLYTAAQTNPFKRPYQPDPTPVSSPQAMPPTKRRKSTSKEAWTMTEDDNLLLQLKDDEGLPWKAIAGKFRDMGRGEFRVPTLQMRYKRLKEKMRVWDIEDIQFLKEAKEHVEKQKWELISQKMLELGCKKKIPAVTCEKKWKEISPQAGPPTPQPSQTSSVCGTEMKRELSQISDDGC